MRLLARRAVGALSHFEASDFTQSGGSCHIGHVFFECAAPQLRIRRTGQPEVDDVLRDDAVRREKADPRKKKKAELAPA